MNASPAAFFDAPDLDMADFQTALRTIRTTTNFDTLRLAAAFRAKPHRAAQRAPRIAAPSPGPCRHCGGRGVFGCDHFLPHNGEAHRG